jgi:HemK-related putative methylase
VSNIEVFPDPIIDYDFENVYRPSDDTYLMVDYFKHHIDLDYFDGIRHENIKKILDMGTGTGYIALSMQIIKNSVPKFTADLYGSDILEKAIHLAKHNEKLNHFKENIRWIYSDLFKSFPNSLKRSFDIIIFNPPYLPSLKHENDTKLIDISWNGGNKGFEVFLNFLDQAKYFISSNCRIYYICSNRTNLGKWYNLIKIKGFDNKILERRHVFMEDLYLNRLTSISS